jgi:hypothetical protein
MTRSTSTQIITKQLQTTQHITTDHVNKSPPNHSPNPFHNIHPPNKITHPLATDPLTSTITVPLLLYARYCMHVVSFMLLYVCYYVLYIITCCSVKEMRVSQRSEFTSFV